MRMRTVLRACLLTGIPVSAAVFLLLTAAVQQTDLPEAVFPMLAAMPAVIGSWLTGHAAARRCRKRGLLRGAQSALLLTGLWCAAAVLIAKKPPGLLLFGISVPAGMLGGIRGVNTPAPRLCRRLHRIPAGLSDLRLRIEIRRNLTRNRNF